MTLSGPPEKSTNVIPGAKVRSVDVWHWPTVKQPAGKSGYGGSHDVAAESLSPPTASELGEIADQACKEGFEEGYREGLEKGQLKGLEEGETEMNQRLGALESLLVAFQSPLGDIEEKLAERLQLLVKNVCETLLEREFSIDSTALERSISSALVALNPGEHQIRIKTDPKSHQQLLELQENGRLDRTIKLIADTQLDNGSMNVTTKNSGVAAGWRDRLAEMLSELFQPIPDD